MNDNERLTLTIMEVAKTLGISRGLAYDLARQGKLPGVIRLGKRLLISRKCMDEFLSGQGRTPTSGDK